jgi:hypothetical protein
MRSNNSRPRAWDLYISREKRSSLLNGLHLLLVIADSGGGEACVRDCVLEEEPVAGECEMLGRKNGTVPAKD